MFIELSLAPPTPVELRYHVLAHVELKEETKEAMLDHGIDPDTFWITLYSYADHESALARLMVEDARNGDPRKSFTLLDSYATLEVY